VAEKYQNKYRVPSARHQHWDYRWASSYFITICTHQQNHYFGKIIDKKMELSKVGIIADLMWNEINYHAENVRLEKFVVMPNHVHGILTLLKNDEINDTPVETRHALSLPKADPNSKRNPPKTIGESRFQKPGKNSISTIIGGYKSTVTRHANRLKLNFKWQTRFHDHIIRNEQSFHQISNYIINNPKNWKTDKFY